MDFSVLICIYETYSSLFAVIFDQFEEPAVLEHVNLLYAMIHTPFWEEVKLKILMIFFRDLDQIPNLANFHDLAELTTSKN